MPPLSSFGKFLGLLGTAEPLLIRINEVEVKKFWTVQV